MEFLRLGYIDSREVVSYTNRDSRTRIHHRRNAKQRDRLIILLFVFVIGLGFGMLFDDSAAAASSGALPGSIAEANDSVIADGGSTLAAMQYEVQIGDTLWQIAKQHKPDHTHIHTYIDRLKQLNGVTDSVLYEGMLLLLP